jgi:hypothetical protein
MKISLLLLTLMTFSSAGFAQKAELTVLDPNIETSELNPHFNVHHGSTHTSSIPNKADRDLLLVQFEKKTAGWDQLKKDIFYMDLSSKTLKDLSKKYPDFSPKELKELKWKRE